jgi:hypothetical protein
MRFSGCLSRARCGDVVGARKRHLSSLSARSIALVIAKGKRLSQLALRLPFWNLGEGDTRLLCSERK